MRAPFRTAEGFSGYQRSNKAGPGKDLSNHEQAAPAYTSRNERIGRFPARCPYGSRRVTVAPAPDAQFGLGFAHFWPENRLDFGRSWRRSLVDDEVHLLDGVRGNELVRKSSAARPYEEVRLGFIFDWFYENLVFAAFDRECILIPDGNHRYRVTQFDDGKVIPRGFYPSDLLRVKRLGLEPLGHEAASCES